MDKYKYITFGKRTVGPFTELGSVIKDGKTHFYIKFSDGNMCGPYRRYDVPITRDEKMTVHMTVIMFFFFCLILLPMLFFTPTYKEAGVILSKIFGVVWLFICCFYILKRKDLF